MIPPHRWLSEEDIDRMNARANWRAVGFTVFGSLIGLIGALLLRPRVFPETPEPTPTPIARVETTFRPETTFAITPLEPLTPLRSRTETTLEATHS